MDSKTIEKYYQELTKLNIKYENNIAYVKGRNPVTLNEPAKKKPDNRITIPLAKIAVDTVHGYAGRAGDIQLFWESKEIDDSDQLVTDKYIEIMRAIMEHNTENLETSELYHSGLVQGKSYELLWVSDDLHIPGAMTPEFKKIPVNEVVIIWSKELKPKKEAVLRFQKYEEKILVDIYYAKYSERYERKNGMMTTGEWYRDELNDTSYPYEQPPLVIYPVNEDMDSVFEAEKGLIDGNDKILNKTVNEIDRFNALIALMPGRISKEVQNKLIDMGVIDDLNKFDKWPKYLQKDLSGINDLYSGAAKWIQDTFFQSVSVPNFADKDFTNAASGLSLAYKLLGLEFLASKIETYFTQGLQERNELINDVLRVSSKYKVDDYKLVIKSNRNLPTDVQAAAEIAQKLIGVVSKETLLRFLPTTIVDDAEKEMERIEQERDGITVDLEIGE